MSTLKYEIMQKIALDDAQTKEKLNEKNTNLSKSRNEEINQVLNQIVSYIERMFKTSEIRNSGVSGFFASKVNKKHILTTLDIQFRINPKHQKHIRKIDTDSDYYIYFDVDEEAFEYIEKKMVEYFRENEIRFCGMRNIASNNLSSYSVVKERMPFSEGIWRKMRIHVLMFLE